MFTFADMILYLLHLWEDKRLPIQKQSEECILYVYNLLQE